ncbi:hypothetical protein ACUOFU_17035 [Microbacterium arabinogalactanolyticum]|uniref:hypothetical protein n=1 Tax=Microbacterium arabinogalactanolyticum TaxID=69365 RepID=UPI004043F274
MSTPHAPLFTGKEIGIVAGSIAGFILLAIIAAAGGFWTLITLGPLLLVALILGSIALTVWLFYKFGVIVVRDGVIAANQEITRSERPAATQPGSEPTQTGLP